jgi:hypothetical protein
MQQVTPERTGWRDMNLSERHRLWGWDCPAVDLDFLFLEYDRGKAVALVEYKHERAKPQMPIHPTYQAMKDLADRAGVPFFACRYKGDFSEFLVVPLNENARKILPLRTPMSEAGWVSFLYMVRGREVPTSIVDSLMTAF